MSNAKGGTRASGSAVTSTEAQNNFGRVIDRATREGRVFITKYDRPAAVVLSIAAYESLTGEEPVDLEALGREFDEMFQRMQRPGQRRGIERLFSMTSAELGKAARRGATDEG